MDRIKDFFKNTKNSILDFFDGLREIQIFNSDFTLREAIVSMSLLALAIIIGLGISGAISDSINEKNLKYEQTIQIQTEDEFKHCLNTNIPSVFAYGEMKSDESVGFDYIGYNYMYASKTHEHYTRHEEEYTVDDYDSEGKKIGSHTETRVYYSWDYVDGEIKHVDTVLFNNVEFKYEEMDLPYADKYSIDRYDYNDRNVYSAITNNGHMGTLYAEINNKKLIRNSFYENKTTEEVYNSYLSNATAWCVLFWIFWLGICGFGICYFISMENDWLNKN